MNCFVSLKHLSVLILLTIFSKEQLFCRNFFFKLACLLACLLAWQIIDQHSKIFIFSTCSTYSLPYNYFRPPRNFNIMSFFYFLTHFLISIQCLFTFAVAFINNKIYNYFSLSFLMAPSKEYFS